MPLCRPRLRRAGLRHVRRRYRRGPGAGNGVPARPARRPGPARPPRPGRPGRAGQLPGRGRTRGRRRLLLRRDGRAGPGPGGHQSGRGGEYPRQPGHQRARAARGRDGPGPRLPRRGRSARPAGRRGRVRRGDEPRRGRLAARHVRPGPARLYPPARRPRRDAWRGLRPARRRALVRRRPRLPGRRPRTLTPLCVPAAVDSRAARWFATGQNRFRICFILLHDGTTMARIRIVMASLGAAAAVVSATTLAAGASASAGPAPVTAHVWVTTPDGADKLTPMPPATFGSATPAAPTIVVDPTLTYQRMQGFGGAITDSAATVLYRLSPAARAATMRSLFDPVTGDGLDYLRQPIGASDFVATADYTYDDLPAGQTDYAQQHFSIAHDQAQILPLLRQAEAINPHLQIIASPWSPPAWMKTNGSLIGGRLIDDPRIYRSYALYLLKFVQAYKANGVHIDAITVQNEPQNRTPSGYPGTDMPSVQEEKVISDLGHMLRAAGLRPQLFA